MRWIPAIRFLRLAAITVALILLAAPSPRGQGIDPQTGFPIIDQIYLQVPFERQETLVWCWVASAKMVASYFNVSTPSQCRMLEQAYGAPCCSSPSYCARPGHIQEIQRLIGGFGLRYSAMGPPTDGWTLFNIFRQGRPIVLHVNNSHFVVAAGMKILSTPQGPLGVVRVLDPFYGVYDEPLPRLYSRWGVALYVY